MIQCQKCGDLEGPFVFDPRHEKCRCESCYYFDMATYYSSMYIKSKVRKMNASDAVAHMDSIESSVFDELGLQ